MINLKLFNFDNRQLITYMKQQTNNQQPITNNQTYSILGCGWLGFPLAESCIADGIQIKGSTTSSEKITLFKEAGIIPYQINIDKKEDFSDFLNSDVLLIMITSKSYEAYENLVTQIEKSSVEKVIFISSTSVYPRGNKEYTEEDETIDNLLARVEQLFIQNKKFETTVIRFAGLYGGKRHPGNWFKDRKIPQPNGFVNMIHREDCIQIIKTIIKKDIFGEVFNACANHHPTRKEYYVQARKSLQKSAPEFEQPETLVYKKISPAKLIARLDYEFIHTDLLEF